MTKADQPAQRHHGLQADAEDHQNQRIGGQCLPISSARPCQCRQAHKRRGNHRRPEPAQAKTSKLLCRLPGTAVLQRSNRHALESLRPEHQYHGHGQKHDDQRSLWKHADAKRMDQPDQQGRDKRTTDAAQPAGDDDDKGFDNHVHVHLQMCRLARQLQRAAQPGQRAAQHHRAEHERLGIDTQRGQHRAVLRGSAQALAKPRTPQQNVQAQPDQRPERNHRQLVDGEKLVADLHRALEPGEARCKHLVRPKTPLHRVMHRQAQAEGRDQLVQLGRARHSP